MPSFTIFCCHFSVLPMSCSRRQPVTMELHSGRLWVPSRNSGLHGKVEPRSTRRGNSRVRALTDVSWKAAGYIGPVPTLLLPLCPALPLPNFSFSLKRKKKMSLPERSLKEPERIYLVKKNGVYRPLSVCRLKKGGFCTGGHMQTFLSHHLLTSYDARAFLFSFY